MESKTGRILYENNANIQRSIGSTSKIMTYILVMEEVEKGNIKLSDKVKISRNASSIQGSSYYLKKDDVLAVRELLDSMMIISANDSAVALAEYISGNVKKFSIKMNNKAKSLKLKSAYFVNPSGMPLQNKDQNKMSAKDMALLSKYAIEKYGDDLFKVTGQKTFNGRYKMFSRKNTNQLLEKTRVIDGLKTGYTDLAGYCLVSTAKINGSKTDKFIGVVLGGRSSDIRFSDSKKIIEYGLNNFKNKLAIEKGEVLKYSKINSEEYIPIEIISKENISVMAKKNIDISKNKKLLMTNESFTKDILNGKEIKSKLQLNDGTEIEVNLIARRGISILVDEKPIIFEEVYPFIKDGKTLVPLRNVVESLGLKVDWDQSTKTITGENNDTVFKITVGEKYATINDENVELDVSAMILNGKTMVPVRFIGESLGAEVKWNSDIRAVEIQKKDTLK